MLYIKMQQLCACCIYVHVHCMYVHACIYNVQCTSLQDFPLHWEEYLILIVEVRYFHFDHTHHKVYVATLFIPVDLVSALPKNNIYRGSVRGSERGRERGREGGRKDDLCSAKAVFLIYNHVHVHYTLYILCSTMYIHVHVCR